MKKVSALLATGATYLTLVHPTFAQIPINPCPKNQGGAVDGRQVTSFNTLCNISADGALIQTLLTLAFVIATLIALAFLIYGGIKWITSGGDKSAVEGARNMIVAALVGLVIVFLSYLILNFVLNFFGLGDLGGLIIPKLSL